MHGAVIHVFLSPLRRGSGVLRTVYGAISDVIGGAADEDLWLLPTGIRLQCTRVLCAYEHGFTAKQCGGCLSVGPGRTRTGFSPLLKVRLNL